jgi:hypothetical protein
MLLSEIALFLEQQGIGVRAEDLFAGEIPAKSPDNAIGLLNTPGAAYEFVHNANQPVAESPGFQLRVRGPDYEEANARIEAAARVLTLRHQVLSGVRYQSVVPASPPFYLERDGNERHVFVCNFEVSKEPS